MRYPNAEALRTQKEKMGSSGALKAPDIVDGLMKGLDAGKHYIVVSHPEDPPYEDQIKRRMWQLRESVL